MTHHAKVNWIIVEAIISILCVTAINFVINEISEMDV